MKFILSFDRSSLHAPLNYPIYLQLKRLPKNVLLRVLKGLFFSIFRKGYDIFTNERIVEIPFVYQNFDLHKKAKVLDFGCCESKVSIELSSLGYNVTGVDLNEYPFTHPNFHFFKGDFLKNTFESNSFDAVIAISSIEHCGLTAYGSEEFEKGDKKIIDEFYRILKKEGKLFITVPFGKKATIKGLYGQRIYDINTLKSLLSEFRLLKEKYYQGIHRQYWHPVTKEALSNVDSAKRGYVSGVACIILKK